MEELGSECTSHPLLLTVYRLTGVPNTGGSAIVYTTHRAATKLVPMWSSPGHRISDRRKTLREITATGPRVLAWTMLVDSLPDRHRYGVRSRL
eukprot:SAG11_NODE_426_length_9563_cov_7.501479_5_plen_93_part_00